MTRFGVVIDIFVQRIHGKTAALLVKTDGKIFRLKIVFNSDIIHVHDFFCSIDTNGC